jgi:hypothetical protein
VGLNGAAELVEGQHRRAGGAVTFGADDAAGEDTRLCLGGRDGRPAQQDEREEEGGERETALAAETRKHGVRGVRA